MLTENFKNVLEFYHFYNESGQHESSLFELYVRKEPPTNQKLRVNFNHEDDAEIIYQLALEILDETLPFSLQGDAHNTQIFSKKWFKKHIEICNWIHDGPLKKRLQRFYKKIYGTSID